MSSTTETAAGAAAGTDTVVDLRGMWIGLVVLDVFYLIVRIYEQVFGWRAGLDSFAPEFQTYWLSILWTEIPLELVSGIGLAGYLWKTRDRNVDAVTPREEMRRIVNLVQWLTVYGIAIYWGAQRTRTEKRICNKRYDPKTIQSTAQEAVATKATPTCAK
jgi:methane/ammonia monooxygenase subunit C